MPTSIIGLFESQDIARKVVSALAKAGFDEDKIETMTKLGVDETTDRLVEAGYEKDKAQRYGEALQKGGFLIVADVEDDKADEALSTMRSFDVLSPEALLERSGFLLEITEVDHPMPAEGKLDPQTTAATRAPVVHVLVSDVDREVQRLRQQGGEILEEPRDDLEGEYRTAQIRDNGRHRIELREPLGARGRFNPVLDQGLVRASR